jgi:hypothetical protein
MKKGMQTILPPQNKVVQDSEWQEEYGYPVPDLNETNMDYPKELN